MILLINKNVDWESICQKNQAQLNKYNIHENVKIVKNYCKSGDKVILNNKAAYKYESPYNGPFEIP